MPSKVGAAVHGDIRLARKNLAHAVLTVFEDQEVRPALRFVVAPGSVRPQREVLKSSKVGFRRSRAVVKKRDQLLPDLLQFVERIQRRAA